MSDTREAEGGRNPDEYLSTVGGIDPLAALERFGLGPAWLVVLAGEPRERRTGMLEEKGEWVRAVWRRALALLPRAEGCRVNWNTIFLATAAPDVDSLKRLVRESIEPSRQPALETFCVLAEAAGDAREKFSCLDEMLDEVSHRRNFGANQRFRHRLLDGEDWAPGRRDT